MEKTGSTPVNVKSMCPYLAIYPNQSVAFELRNGFTYGFFLQYQGPRISTTCNNLVSVHDHPNEVKEKIDKEISLGRIAGPFDTEPLFNLRLSPIGVVAKKDGGWRLIHHLSHPTDFSVNDFIDPEACSVHYTSFYEVLEMVGSLGKGAVLGKMDVKSAFRLLPVHPSDHQLLGFKFNNFYYYDMCLPMGCSISCALWEKFAHFVQWVVEVKTGVHTLNHYLDDFIFAGDTSEICELLMSSFRKTCFEFGIPLAEDKTEGPKTVITFLGIVIDTDNMIIRIPNDKILTLETAILEMLQKEKVTLGKLQSLVGSLNFCAKAIPSARAFNRRFCDAMCGIKHSSHFIRVTSGMRSDLCVWLDFIHKYNGSLNFMNANWLSNDQLHLYTDSAGNHQLGCGVYFNGQWAYFEWPACWKDLDIMSDITFLELVPIVLAVDLFKTQFCDKKILFHTDNKALVSILNKKSSKSVRVMELIRPLVLYSMIHNIYFKACHIAGYNNAIADSISRKQWTRFRALAPKSRPRPIQIPEDFIEMISKLK